FVGLAPVHGTKTVQEQAPGVTCNPVEGLDRNWYLLAANISLNNSSLVFMTLSLNQVIRRDSRTLLGLLWQTCCETVEFRANTICDICCIQYLRWSLNRKYRLRQKLHHSWCLLRES
ncbi:MAG: hypothetical protein FRX49_13784, partial [Trebouxia sp. A1-2]